MLLLGNIKGLGTALLRQPASLSLSLSLSHSLSLSPDCGGRRDGGGGSGGDGGVRGGGSESILIDALSHRWLASLFGPTPPEIHATFFSFLC